MLKNIEAHDKVTFTRVIEIPVDIAAEVLSVYCSNTNRQCVLVGVGSEEYCPFSETHCKDINKEMWENYINGQSIQRDE